MPKLSANKTDFEKLFSKSVELTEFEDLLSYVKGELKFYEKDNDELRIELNDTNRPDLWSTEGIARQLSFKTGGADLLHKRYSAFLEELKKAQKESPKHKILVNQNVLGIRPAIAGFVAKGLKITPQILEQLIQTQEKLSQNFGAKRKTVSIGIYDYNQINFPVSYKAVKPNELSFAPLGFEEVLSLEEILAKHPKGQEFGGILSGFSSYPILLDAEENVLSFPPIINSNSLGQVKVGDENLFIEVTGWELDKVQLAANILAFDLLDRGAVIEPVEISYPKNEIFNSYVAPLDLNNTVEVSLEDVARVVGEKVTAQDLKEKLYSYGCLVTECGQGVSNSKRFQVKTLPYRYDYLHGADCIEDYIISRGYDNFEPESPASFTVGALTPQSEFYDRVRNLFVGLGFEEMISNFLLNRDEIINNMNLGNADVCEIANPMNLNYSVVRNSLLPCLLRLEATSFNAAYPHKVFEVGEVVKVELKEKEEIFITSHQLGCLIAHPKANFSELHSLIENLFYNLALPINIVPLRHDSFIEGRTGAIEIGGDIRTNKNSNETSAIKSIGVIGEVHPQVLSNWDIKMPCVACEINLDFIWKLQ